MFVLAFDSVGEEALNSALEAKDYGDARAIEIGEVASAGSMLILGFLLLVIGARGLRLAMVTFRGVVKKGLEAYSPTPAKPTRGP